MQNLLYKNEHTNMQYNYRKLQVLYAIKMCKQNKVYPTSISLSKMVGIKLDNMTVCLARYLDWRYVTRRRKRGMRAQVYSLTKLGVHTLKLYMARYLNGTHLNLVHKPRPCDFKDDGILLPGYENEHNRKDI